MVEKENAKCFWLIIIFQRNICSLSTGPLFFDSRNSGSRSSTIDHASTGTVPCVNVNQAPRGGGEKTKDFSHRPDRASWDPRYGDRLHDFQALLCSTRVVNSARKLTFRLASTHSPNFKKVDLSTNHDSRRKYVWRLLQKCGIKSQANTKAGKHLPYDHPEMQAVRA